jgi:acyl-CoA synthetase (AMP-forming)/AMP-acid ligase II/aryl carrier-like protein
LNTIADVLRSQARRDPGAAAILAPGRAPMSYGALLGIVEQAARTLARAGLGRGSRIVVALPAGPEVAVALLAVGCCATCAPLNPATDEEACHVLLKSLRADALIVRRSDPLPVRRVALALGLPIVELVERGADAAGSFSLHTDRHAALEFAGSPGPSDIALLITTSGTTGKPKVLPIVQEDLIDSIRRQVALYGFTSADRCLGVAPMFTTSGIRRSLLSMLAAGGSIVCPAAFDAGQFLDLVNQFGATYYAAGPATHLALLEAHEKAGPVAVPSLRFVWSGATTLPPDIAHRLESLLGVPVIQAYGMSEAGLVATNPLPPGIRRDGSVGRPAGPDVQIQNDAGAPLPAHETGEVVLRGAGIIRAYENDPEANRAAFRDGWFRTGDLGHFDDDGYLYLTGRVKELMNRGGMKVSPFEVDAALLRHPDVVEAAAFAVAHPTLGEDVAAAVVARSSSVTSQQLRDFLLDRLAAYKVPSHILLVAALPRNPLGKVRRHDLARLLGDSLREKFTPPRGPREQDVARAFASVLGTPNVGAFDNFFQLGGDSLRGAQLLSQFNAALGTRLTTALLFRRPTVAEFAALLDQLAAAGPAREPPPIASQRRVGQAVHPVDGSEPGWP